MLRSIVASFGLVALVWFIAFPLFGFMGLVIALSWLVAGFLPTH